MKKYESIDQLMRDYITPAGSTLVVGAKCYGSKIDRRQLYDNAVGIDLFEGEGVDFVHDIEKPLYASYDHIDCCSMLEHCRQPWLAAKNMEDSLEIGGTILISVPFTWRVHAYPSDYWRMTIEALPVLFPSIQWKTRGYLLDSGKYVKIIERREKDGIRWLRRSEAIGVGVKVETSLS